LDIELVCYITSVKTAPELSHWQHPVIFLNQPEALEFSGMRCDFLAALGIPVYFYSILLSLADYLGEFSRFRLSTSRSRCHA